MGCASVSRLTGALIHLQQSIDGYTMIRTFLLALTVATTMIVLPPAFAAASTDLAKALGSSVRHVVAGNKKAIGVLSSDGHYTATTADGREVGLFFARSEWRFAEAPYFAIDLVDGTHNLVIVPEKNRLKTDKTPKDWLWTDYKREGKTARSPSVPAGNLPRVLTVREPGRAYVLDGGFVKDRSLMKNAVSVVMIWHDGVNVHTASLGVNHARDEVEARELIAAMTTLLPASWPRK